MTRTRIAKLAAAVSLALAAGIAAADTQSLSVTASVTGVCKFNSSQSPVLDFGPIDPSSTSNATATPASVKYKCTKGTAATVDSSVTSAPRTMTGTGTANGDTMKYTLSFTSGGTGTGTGFGAGEDLTLVLGGTITPTDFQNKTVGDYSEDVTLTVNP